MNIYEPGLVAERVPLNFSRLVLHFEDSVGKRDKTQNIPNGEIREKLTWCGKMTNLRLKKNVERNRQVRNFKHRRILAEH